MNENGRATLERNSQAGDPTLLTTSRPALPYLRAYLYAGLAGVFIWMLIGVAAWRWL